MRFEGLENFSASGSLCTCKPGPPPLLKNVWATGKPYLICPEMIQVWLGFETLAV